MAGRARPRANAFLLRSSAYTERMVRRLTVRMAPITNRAAEYAPMAPACCNVCRTCTTTNIVGLALGGATAAGVALGRLVKRPRRASV